MTLTVLFSASQKDWDNYSTALTGAFQAAGLTANLVTEADPETVDYIIYTPTTALKDFTPYTNTKAVLSLWAGVEKIVTNETLTMPLVRMVDPGMTQTMTEWVVAHVMRYHVGMDAHIVNPDHEWAPRSKPISNERTVCILGLGALGADVARVLSDLRFNVTGWSRSPKQIANVTSYHGDDGLAQVLATADIVALLMPDTAETENTINAATLAHLPKGAFIINPGRGPLIDDAALVAALDSGQVAHATLDVFRVEPLPKDHPFWAHPNVTVTPHIAAETRPITASRVIAENIARGEAGQPFEHVVDRARGY